MIASYDIGRIAERMAVEFDGQVPFETMIGVLQRCIHQNAFASPEQVEQAVRRQLQAGGRVKPARPPMIRNG